MAHFLFYAGFLLTTNKQLWIALKPPIAAIVCPAHSHQMAEWPLPVGNNAVKGRFLIKCQGQLYLIPPLAINAYAARGSENQGKPWKPIQPRQLSPVHAAACEIEMNKNGN